MISALGALALVASALFIFIGDKAAKSEDPFFLATDIKGRIKVPDVNYRRDWVALGSWVVNGDEGTGSAKGIHTVYSQRETVEAYLKTGKFPDGAVLVKELFSTKTEDMTTGSIARSDKVDGWFVMIKDTRNRFPYHKLWGDGWGWAYFDGKDAKNTTSTDYKADCKGCHVPAQNNDWVYVEGYPVLRK